MPKHSVAASHRSSVTQWKRKGKSGTTMCDYRGVSLEFLREFASRVFSGELALNIKLFVFDMDFQPEKHPGVFIRKGKTALRKRKEPGGSYLMDVPGVGDVVVDSSCMRFKDRLDWDMDDICEYIVKRNAVLKRDKLTFNEIIASKHPSALSKRFQATYVSHSRSTKLSELVDSLENHFRGKKQLRKAHVWLDEFGTNLNYVATRNNAESPFVHKNPTELTTDVDGDEIDDNYFGDMQASSDENEHTEADEEESKRLRKQFLQGEQLTAIKRFGDFFLFVPALDNFSVLSRLWCLWEIYGAAFHKVKFNVVFPGYDDVNPFRMANLWVECFDQALLSINNLDFTKAQCKNRDDQKVIISATESAGGVNKINDIVKLKIREWVGSALTKTSEACAVLLKKGRVQELVQVARLIEFQSIVLQSNNKTGTAVAERLKELVVLQRKFSARESAEINRIKRSIASIVLECSPGYANNKPPMASYSTSSVGSRSVGSSSKVTCAVDSDSRAKRPSASSFGADSDNVSASSPTSAHAGASLHSGRKPSSVPPSQTPSVASTHKTGSSFARKFSYLKPTSFLRRSPPTPRIHAPKDDATNGVEAEVARNPESEKRIISSQELLSKAREEGSTVQAADLSGKGKELVALGHKAEAIEMYQEALRIFRRMDAEDHLNDGYIDALLELAQILKEKCAFGTAVDRLDEALQVIDKAAGEESAALKLAQVHGIKGRVLSKQGEYEAALESLDAACSVYFQLGASAQVEKIAPIEREMGHVLHMQEDHKQALRKFEAAIDHFRQCYGETHELIADTLNDMAIVTAKIGKTSQAAAFEREALHTWKEALGETDPTIGDALNNFAVLLDDLGDRKAALEFYREALEMFSVSFGETHCRVADTHYNIGAVLHGLKRYIDSMEHYKAALHIYNHNDHPHASLTLANISVILETQGRLDEAYCAARDALSILERKCGEDHPQTQKMKRKLARITRKRYQKQAKAMGSRQTSSEARPVRKRRPSAMQRFKDLALGKSSQSGNAIPLDS
eukprot:CAMPEP_0184546476 /NCGR_PEP_ID=MMETSP0199_2-20130426/4977_1 /TAXON_ID=1112570 /ORGANISM="Thraustochytrium sp., Strain LLF1b" /LENGTH=1027 /DNA_ID=CAMNT_0026940887 /DNA_START=499 /DNA_END=3582 /DNA_ORIENTATION=-